MTTTTNDMKITIYATADSLDPNDTSTDPQASLKEYMREVESEIKREWPDADVVLFESLRASESWTLRYEGDDREQVERRIQEIIETVYEVGMFWR